MSTWKGSMYRSEAVRVTLAMRRATTCVSGLRSHSLCEHQHCELVRTGESTSPAKLRLNWCAQPSMKAATCSVRRRVWGSGLGSGSWVGLGPGRRVRVRARQPHAEAAPPRHHSGSLAA